MNEQRTSMAGYMPEGFITETEKTFVHEPQVNKELKPEVLTTVPQEEKTEHIKEMLVRNENNNYVALDQQPKKVQEDITKVETSSVVPKTAKDDAFISDAFDDFAKSLVEGNELITEDTVSVDDLLKNIKVDLSSIEISNSNVLNIERTENLFKNKKVTQVTACQSAYTAYMSALTNQEIQNLIGSDEDFYSFRKRIIKLTYKHQEDTSIGRLTFPLWEKLTSFFDLETLLYGIYCQTFPYDNTYNVTCPNRQCGHKYTTVANNNTIVEVRGKDGIFEQLNDIVQNVRTPQQAMDKSLVHTTKRMICDESKIIVDIRIPSVYDYLEGLLSKVNPQFAEENSNSLGMALFINKIYIPDLATLKDTGKLTYFEINDSMKIMDYITNLSFMDAETVTQEINDFSEKYKISYSLKNVVCPECGEVISEIPLDIEQLLFHTIHTIRARKATKA